MITVEYAATKIDSPYKHVVEFGVASGRTISLLRQRLSPDYQIFGFDSFEGLPEDWVNTPQGKGAFSTGGVIPDVPGVTFYKGWFEDTLPEFVKVAEPLALLHMDCDLYSSTVTVFNYMTPFIKAGTLIVFDEWCYNHDPKFDDHEQKAFYEWVEQYNVKYEFISYYDHENPIERKIVKILSIDN